MVYLTSCGKKSPEPDAYGNFEAEETIVSAQATGSILKLNLQEGQLVKKGDTLGHIDPEQLLLQRAQLQAQLAAVKRKEPDVAAQTSTYAAQEAVQRQQLATLKRELRRTQNLVAADAAPTKQLDDQQAQIDVLERQIALTAKQREAQRSALLTQKSGTSAEAGPILEQIKQVDDQLNQAYIVAPIDGTILTKYAEMGEVATYGKAICSIAPLNRLTLRAYLQGDLLSQVKNGQNVRVAVDGPDKSLLYHTGTVAWISSQAEFTPKVIQTRDERVNLVYAVKISVPNDGSLKIGMPGEVFLSDANQNGSSK